MHTLKKFIVLKLRKYSTIINFVKRSKNNNIKGRLEVLKDRKYYKYYHVMKDPVTGKAKRTYIKKEKIELAKSLAQQAFNQKLLRKVIPNFKLYKFLYDAFEEDEVETLFKEMDEGRKVLVQLPYQVWEQKLEEWRGKEYPKKGFRKDDLVIFTKNNERVRSKIEKILADGFSDRGLYYKYECPLRLKNGLILHPDFTFLSPYTHKEVYWEHLGKIDDPEYALKALLKLRSYAENGIELGEQLLLTFESSTQTINQNYVNHLIYKYLINK